MVKILTRADATSTISTTRHEPDAGVINVDGKLIAYHHVTSIEEEPAEWWEVDSEYGYVDVQRGEFGLWGLQLNGDDRWVLRSSVARSFARAILAGTILADHLNRKTEDEREAEITTLLERRDEATA